MKTEFYTALAVNLARAKAAQLKINQQLTSLHPPLVMAVDEAVAAHGIKPSRRPPRHKTETDTGRSSSGRCPPDRGAWSRTASCR